MPLFRNSIIAEPSATDRGVVAWDGTTGQEVHGLSPATLSAAGLMTLATTSSQIVVAGTTSSFVVAGATLSPHIIAHTDVATAPNVAWARDSTAATGAPTHNFFRSRAGGVLNNGDSLTIISGLGHDGTDYAPGAQIDMVVDEADTGTSAVGANQMGTMIRFLTSRRTTQSPSISLRIRHNGAAQFNTAMTVLATPSAGCMEADAKVQYYTPEDFNRGVVATEYFICPTGAYTLNATTTEQTLFGDVGTGTLTIPTGTYRFETLLSMSAMDAAGASNMAFDILGAGTATVAALYMSDGGENAINTTGANTMGSTNTAQTTAAMITGSANAALQVRSSGVFRVTAAGTIIPSATLAVAAAAVRSANSFFCCRPWGTSTVQTAGRWS